MFWPLILTFIQNFALSTPQNLEKKVVDFDQQKY